ncbi:hypothetical protein AVEN_55635-1 [Araneus ventricosus]|uniref:Helitron helicase-like domain-containing protein n=1 Tax=Araneus ventricosus TaxID=182803 RepID=A0A4Y2GHH1_ARAVE|nr:hypothetical protein AVEN_55635-1 [Araneus ventricosus]
MGYQIKPPPDLTKVYGTAESLWRKIAKCGKPMADGNMDVWRVFNDLKPAWREKYRTLWFYPGPYFYRIHGQIYHKVSSLYSNHNKPGYGQMHVFDTSKATEKRIERNEGCLPSVMERLDSMMRAINPFIECYLQMNRIIKENPATNIRMVFMENGDLDLRRYKQPTSKTETAAVFEGDNGEPPANKMPEYKWIYHVSKKVDRICKSP